MAFVFVSPSCYAFEKIILRVLLNSEDKGDYFIMLSPDGEIMSSPEDVKAMGLKEVHRGSVAIIGSSEYIPLSSFSSILRTQIDFQTATLHLTVEPKFLKKNLIDLSQPPPEKVVHARDNSAFINYRLNYHIDNQLNPASFNLPLEAGVNINEYLVLTSFIYSGNDIKDRFARLMTSITRDDTTAQRRFVAGDFSATSGILGGGGILGGLNVSKNFSLTPYFIKYPSPTYKGVVNTPSTVDIYSNNILLKHEVLSPGEFELVNLPVTAGYREVTVITKDSEGREEQITKPFYMSMSLLKPDISEYTFNAGFRRNQIGQKNFEYGNPVFLFSYRLGFRDDFTAGIRGETEKGMFNLGTTVTTLFGKTGEISASAAVSRVKEITGYGGILNYFFAGRRFVSRMSIQGFSEDYANLSIMTSQNKPRIRGDISISYGNMILGSISASYSVTDNHAGTDMTRSSIYFNRRLGKQVSLYITANNTRMNTIENDIFAGLNFLFGNGISGGVSSQIQENRHSEQVYIQQNPSSRVGWGYGMQINRSEDDKGNLEAAGNASVQYYGPYGNYHVNYRNHGGRNSYDLGMAGGLAFIDRSIFVTSPIHDGFALVKVGGVQDVRVYSSNQLINESNKHGKVLVPGLISYYPNNLSISDQDIPLDYNVHEITKNISVPYRGGGIVRFEISRLHSFVGYMYFIIKGRKIPAEYAGIEIIVDGKIIQGIAGKNGEFYMENLPPGRFPARLILGDEQCQFDITIPESDSTMVDMGEISCEVP